MNFPAEFQKGQKGENKGLWMGEGLKNIYKAINGIQKAKYFVVASAPKVGKSTFVNYGFLYEPYLHSLKEGLKVSWLYWSLEMSRIDLEFDAMCFFLNHDYNIETIKLPKNVFKNNRDFIPLSPSLLRGREMSDAEEVITVPDSLVEVIKELYVKRIIPLFGEYNEMGLQIQRGACQVYETPENPTGIYYQLLDYAESRGQVIRSTVKEQNRIVGYHPHDDKEQVIVILDHARKTLKERGFNEKENIEKMSSYFIEIRNILKYTIVNIIHLNRSLNDLNRFKQFGENLYPDSDMIKSSANLSEDCDYAFTMFNPNDERYNLKRHFGLDIKNAVNHPIYPSLRTVHLVESRHTFYPQHFKSLMKGNLKKFELFNK